MMMIPRRRNEFDLFDDFFRGDDFFPRREHTLMKTDVKEKGDNLILEVDLPGYEKENINLELKEGNLIVTAKVEKENNSDKDERYIHKERFYGECSRSFYVGEDVTEEDISAEFKNGTLKITFPKNDSKKELPQAKKIEIQ